MRPLKLHTKTTLLASAITVAVLAVALAYTTMRVAEIVRDEQKARAGLQALSFAEQIGAVELVEQLEDAPTIARSYERTAALMALVAVVLITLGTYLLFRQLVYRPVERLLGAMARAEGGDLSAHAPARAPDELGLLSRSFNRMIARLRTMTEEREAQRRVLQERVQE